ncbi:MAG: hypothetical protein J3K34DRAFT_5761 [Monoraphidium minutum]|nr:MAG: hypothetical protein J3K34DRAFT_5761 [Monoraphidium minutum]
MAAEQGPPRGPALPRARGAGPAVGRARRAGARRRGGARCCGNRFPKHETTSRAGLGRAKGPGPRNNASEGGIKREARRPVGEGPHAQGAVDSGPGFQGVRRPPRRPPGRRLSASLCAMMWGVFRAGVVGWQPRGTKRRGTCIIGTKRRRLLLGTGAPHALPQSGARPPAPRRGVGWPGGRAARAYVRVGASWCGRERAPPAAEGARGTSAHEPRPGGGATLLFKSSGGHPQSAEMRIHVVGAVGRGPGARGGGAKEWAHAACGRRRGPSKGRESGGPPCQAAPRASQVLRG